LKSVYSEYSFSKFLRKDNKSSDEFEFMLNKLSLEEIIALKLELSARGINGKLYGFKLWNTIPKITKEALLIFAISATSNLYEAQTLLGISDKFKFRDIIKKHKDILIYYKVKDLKGRNYMKSLL